MNELLPLNEASFTIIDGVFNFKKFYGILAEKKSPIIIRKDLAKMNSFVENLRIKLNILKRNFQVTKDVNEHLHAFIYQLMIQHELIKKTVIDYQPRHPNSYFEIAKKEKRELEDLWVNEKIKELFNNLSKKLNSMDFDKCLEYIKKQEPSKIVCIQKFKISNYVELSKAERELDSNLKIINKFKDIAKMRSEINKKLNENKEFYKILKINEYQDFLIKLLAVTAYTIIEDRLLVNKETLALLKKVQDYQNSIISYLKE